MAIVCVTGSRSLYGCWTCRLRKKKCDESRPACTTCTSLELQCHGFGPRPEWMDRGVLQREKALEVKRILKNNTPKRHLRRSHGTTQDFGPQSDAIPDGEASLWNDLESSYDHDTGVAIDRVLSQNNPNQVNVGEDLTTCSVPMWDEKFCSELDFGEIFFDQEDSMPLFNQGPLDGSSETSRIDNQREANLKDLGYSSDQAYSTSSTHNGDLAKRDADESLYKPPSLIQKSLFSDCAYPGRHNSWSGSSDSSDSILCEHTEDMLFMHYIDEVFHIQYPFYHTPEAGKGWLFSILRRDISAYYATLALSGYHRYSTLSRHNNFTGNSILLRAANEHYDLAFQQMQLSLGQASTWSGRTALDRSVGTLVSIHQLLYWELFHGGTENWQIHLQAANTLLPALVRHVQTSTATQGTISSGSRREQHHEHSLHSEYDSISRFLLSSFLSMDIFSCVSTRRLFLELDHKHLLERRDVYLEHLGGCKKSVLVLIFEILQLDTWKREARKTQKLSIVDLARRGGEIEKRLQEELANIEDHTSLAAFTGHPLGISTSTEITKIFALSAMTYLHVVISGAHPKLPEIQRSVSNTITAFQHLTDAKLLRNLVWPFCITGSLALEAKHVFFRNLISTAGVAKSDFGTCFEAFKIIEECWKMRKMGSSNCDWISAMDKYSRYILLA